MKYKQLREIAEIIMGQSPESSSYNTQQDGLPFFQGNADFGELYPTERIWCSSPIKIAEKNDILISVRAPIGAVNIASTKCCIGRGLAAIRIENSNERNYVFHLLKAKNKELNLKGTGSTFKAIGKSVLEEINIPDIPQDAQTTSMQIMDNLEYIIRQRKQELLEMDSLVKARFVEMFGDQKTNPLGWKQACIGDVCTLKSGTSLPIDKENEGGDIPYIKVGDMNYPGNERYIISSSRFVSRKTAGKGIFNIGSIIFPKRGGAIGTNKKRMTKVPICADLNIMGITPNGELIPEYLLSYFDMLDMRELADGSSVPQINNKNISPLKICVPPLIKQEEFAKIVKQIDKSKAAVQKSLDETQLLFDSLMQKYFG